MNVIGEPVDEGRDRSSRKATAPIHQPAPAYTDQSTESEILVTRHQGSSIWGNWSATEIDLATDRETVGETSFTELERRATLWTYSMFFHGEDSVADKPFSVHRRPPPREEQKYFLATQQADEARHAVLFARFHVRGSAGEGNDTWRRR